MTVLAQLAYRGDEALRHISPSTTAATKVATRVIGDQTQTALLQIAFTVHEAVATARSAS